MAWRHPGGLWEYEALLTLREKVDSSIFNLSTHFNLLCLSLDRVWLLCHVQTLKRCGIRSFKKTTTKMRQSIFKLLLQYVFFIFFHSSVTFTLLCFSPCCTTFTRFYCFFWLQRQGGGQINKPRTIGISNRDPITPSAGQLNQNRYTGCCNAT